MKTFIRIKKKDNNTFEIETFEGDFNIKTKNIRDTPKIERVSHIYPQNPILRYTFIILRKIFGDKSIIADWTRKWKCKWIIVFKDDPNNFIGPFRDRKEAIKVEREIFVKKILEQK